MCGIAGTLQQGVAAGRWPALLEAMSERLAHRGPDDAGLWYDPEAGAGLGHRRLAILDLSPASRQPMASRSGRYRLAYNGEVYNFRALREALQARGHGFRGGSDTEVVVAAIEQEGLVPAVRQFAGMFAFALWDAEQRCLHLACDRLGIKPLYYGWLGDAFVFGSELKSLQAHPAFRGEIDREAVVLFMRYGYIPAPYTIYRGVHKLLPGTILTVSPGQKGVLPAPAAYWSLGEVVRQACASPFAGTEGEALEHLSVLLREAVASHTVSDVPVGVFLSGGVDSSVVAAFMQAGSAAPVKSFCIGFDERGFDEGSHARAVARHLGTDHTEHYVTAREALEVVPHLPALYDEPFADSSSIPVFLVSRLARSSVKVCLSGEGGDELFAGYSRYVRGLDRHGLYRKGHRLREALATALPWAGAAVHGLFDRMNVATVDRLFRRPLRLSRRSPSVRAAHQRLRLMAESLHVDHPRAIYLKLVSLWKDPASVVPGAAEPGMAAVDPGRWVALPDFAHQMMYLDTLTNLPGDLLTKVDRASMAVGLEVRVPFLDHRLLAFVWSLPLAFKLRHGQGKWLLRQLLHRDVPRALVDRPKMGFSVPLAAWLRGPLRAWAEDLLAPDRLRREGFLDPGRVQQAWNAALRSPQSWAFHPLWCVLMFQAWLEHEERRPAPDRCLS